MSAPMPGRDIEYPTGCSGLEGRTRTGNPRARDAGWISPGEPRGGGRNMSAQMQVLALAFAITFGAMLTGMWLMGADKRGYLRSPLYAVVALFLGVLSWNALRAHVLPAIWGLTRPALLYYGALTLYALYGFALGLLVGRATRKRDPFPTRLEPARESEDKAD
jgi:hypothetical protein